MNKNRRNSNRENMLRDHSYRGDARPARGKGQGKRILTVMLVLCLLVAAAAAIIGFRIRTSAADLEHVTEYKYYTSIRIEKGDTLWKLADEYRGSRYDSAQDYIDEVIELNELPSEKLIEGQYLTVPYYSEDFR